MPLEFEWGSTLKFYIALAIQSIFTILTLPIREHDRSFCLLVSSISFKTFFFFLHFPLLGSFIFLVRFIHSYSLFETHRISFSASLLLVYRKAVDACVLILYLVIFLSGCIGSKIFFWWRFKGILSICSCHLLTGKLRLLLIFVFLWFLLITDFTETFGIVRMVRVGISVSLLRLDETLSVSSHLVWYWL